MERMNAISTAGTICMDTAKECSTDCCYSMGEKYLNINIIFYVLLVALLLSMSIPSVSLAMDDVQQMKQKAEEGDSHAQTYLGYSYYNGEGVGKNLKEAAKWYRRAAEQGVAITQYLLGNMYRDGEGVKKDSKDAAMWYHKAADQGIDLAQVTLGHMYRTGEGVPQDDKEAAKWFIKAAEQGLEDAQYTLGLLYKYGKGVPQDDVKAYAWWSLASMKGAEDAIKNRDLLAAQLSPQEKRDGRRFTLELMVKIGDAKPKEKN